MTLRLNQLLTTLRQPQWIAAIVSLGVHGALFAAGPSFSSLNATNLGGGSPELEERRVPLIELTPDEQGRLPDFSAPTYSLLPGNDNDLFSLFPPSGDSLPLDPGSDFGASIKIPTPQLPSSSSPTGISPYTSPGRSTIRLAPRRSTLPSLPSSGALRQRPDATAQESTPGAASTPTATAPENANAPRAADLDLRRGAQGNVASSTPSASTTPSGSNTAETEQANNLLARVEFSADQTSAADVEIAKAAWLQSVEAKLGDTVAEAPEPITLEVPYSGRLCLDPQPTDGLLGVVGVPGEENGLKLWTAVLKSTGYPFLNQAAEQALQDLQQQATTDDESPIAINTRYEVVVEIDYNSQDCISHEALLQSRTAEPGSPAAPAVE